MKQLVLFVFLAACACAQPVGFGIKAGVPLSNALRTVRTQQLSTLDTSRYIVGPMVELRLPFGLAVEADALYTGFEGVAGGGIALAGTESISGSQWQFPIVAKYKLGGVPLIRPYVEGGVAFSRLVDVKNTVLRVANGPGVSVATDRGTRGLVLGAGAEIRALFLRISPEVRYIRWGDDAFSSNQILRFNQNQAQFLVGFSF